MDLAGERTGTAAVRARSGPLRGGPASQRRHRRTRRRNRPRACRRHGLLRRNRACERQECHDPDPRWLLRDAHASRLRRRAAGSRGRRGRASRHDRSERTGRASDPVPPSWDQTHGRGERVPRSAAVLACDRGSRRTCAYTGARAARAARESGTGISATSCGDAVGRDHWVARAGPAGRRVGR